MSQADLYKTHVESLTGGNHVYTDLKDQWQYLLEAFLGGESWRDGSHLTKYNLEQQSEYQARLNTSHLPNHCKSVINVYNSFLFREAPYRDLGSLTNLQEAEEFLKDANHEGESLDSVMKNASQWSSVFGHCWLILTKPNVNALTRADEMVVGARPYVNIITPLSMLDWQYERLASGKYILKYIKYIEDTNDNIHVIKEWTEQEIKTSTVKVEERSEEIIDQTVEVNGLGKIPCITVYSQKGLIRGVGTSDINDIADAQRKIYNLHAELEETIRLDSHPSIVMTPDTVGGSSGPGSIIQVPNDIDPNLRPYVLSYNGANVKSILESITEIVESIDMMANTGGVRAKETRTLSGVAMETEFQLLNARLSEKADNLELAEEQLWRCFAMYYDRTWDGYVDYPGSFNIRDTQTEYQQLKTAKETATNPKLLRLLDERLVELLDEDPKEILDNDVNQSNPELTHEPMTSPDDMIVHIREMIEQGYTNDQIKQLHPEIAGFFEG
jgi:hypothetical protein